MEKFRSFGWSDLKRAVSSKGFLIGIILLTAVFLNAIRLYVRTDGSMSMYEIILDAVALSGLGPFAAVFPSLGYSSQFCQEYNSGYLKMIRCRMGWKRYAVTRIISVGISGGCIMLVPYTFLMLYAYIIGNHTVPDFMEDMVLAHYVENYGNGYVLMFKVLLAFLFGVLFSLISLAFAVWSVNRYVATIAPFILYEMLWALLPLNLMYLNPIYMLRGDHLGSYPLSACMEMIYIILALVAVWTGMRKRMKRK